MGLATKHEVSMVTSIIRVVGLVGEGLTGFTQRWVPDSWVVCMVLTVLTILLAMGGAQASLNESVLAWGNGMWSLLELAMQFTIAMIAANACVASRPVYRLLDRLARLPNPSRPLQAIVLMGAFSMITAYVNWALSLVASALFVPFIARHNPKVDIRVMIAAAYLGLGTVWHGGLSGSAPLILATPGNPLLEPATGAPVIGPPDPGYRNPLHSVQSRLPDRHRRRGPRHRRRVTPAWNAHDTHR